MPLDAYRFKCSACGALEIVDLPLNSDTMTVENRVTEIDIEYLEANIHSLTKKSQTFAQSLVTFYKNNGYLTEKQWDRVFSLVGQVRKSE